jgi:hypothetical protein
MTVRFDRSFVADAFGPGFVVLLAASIALALLASIPWVEGVALAAAGAVLAGVVRAAAPRRFRFLGLVPALLVLGGLVAESPVGVLPELVGGLVGLALLLWCAGTPERLPGAFARGLGGVSVPAAVLAIALASSLLLPAGLGSLGIAGALLVAAVAGVALLVSAPHRFDAPEPPIS